jgi:hypothetical protein
MNTRENNKLIAEFMGYRECPMKLYRMDDKFESVTIYSMYQDEDEYLTIEAGKKQVKFSPNEMEFHTSWDWLMPVVEKIEREHKANFITKCIWNEFNECSYYQVIVNIEKGEMSKDRSCIYDSKKVYDYIGESIKDKRKATHEAVVQFIKWYN